MTKKKKKKEEKDYFELRIPSKNPTKKEKLEKTLKINIDEIKRREKNEQ